MRFEEPEDFPPLPDLPDFLTNHMDPFAGMDDNANIGFVDNSVTTTLPPLLAARPALPVGAGGVDDQPISRNAPCPCGSGKKFKHCHGSA